ncbi:MAG: hypothetical protein K6A45_03565 [Lachnospiraceae bacterium]|nr:hypothetical protein [Lachnospiraceae bacterium]
MEKLYWAFEYGKVFFAYMFILFLWPSVVFKKHLKKRTSRTYKLAFCSVVMPVLINTVVLGLGLVGLLKPFVFNILFYGLFLYFLIKDHRIKKVNKLRFKNMFSGTYGKRTIFLDLWRLIKKKTIKFYNIFSAYMKGHWGEYGVLFVLLIFGAVFFSVNCFQQTSYGFSDMYVHHEWIYNLTQGNIFSSGVYPEAMHCFIAVESMTFGVSIYSALLFTGAIHSLLFMTSLYIMLKEFFGWKWSAMLALALFLIVDTKQMNAVVSISRLQTTLPQEFGFPAMLFCPAFLIRFFKNGKKYVKSKIPVFIRDDDLLVFTLSLSVTIGAHFYATIMAFFICLGAAVTLIFRFFSKKFLSLIAAIFAGVLIAVLPMALAVAEGYRLQGSLYWALSVIDPSRLETSENASNNTDENIIEDNTVEDNTENGQGASAQQVTEEKRINTAQPKVSLAKWIEDIFTVTYVYMYGEERAPVFIQMSLINTGIWLAVRILVFKRRRKDDEYRFKGNQFDGYMVIVLASVILTLSSAMRRFGLPQLIDSYRVFSIAHIMALTLLVIPLDVIGTFIIDGFKKQVGTIITAILIVGIYVGAKLTGNFRGYLLIALTRHNSSVNVTNSILEKMGKGNNNFTIVSTTDELYPILGYGYHEELVNFINKSEEDTYTIPTEYIFIYIEKNALERPHYHYANGPSWLAECKYVTENFASVGSKVSKKTISKDYADLYFGKFPLDMSVYNTLWVRVVLFSKAFEWCQKFNAMYPNELHTFYEDEDLLVYYLRQNPRNLYELATMDTSNMLPPESYSMPIWPNDYRNHMQSEE